MELVSKTFRETFSNLLGEEESIPTKFIQDVIKKENTKECVDLIDDIFNKNFSEEYDNEETITPIKYSVNNV